MHYSNQPEPEGINAADDGRGQLREFVLLGGAFLVLAAIALLLITRAGAWLGPLIPFAWEVRVMPQITATKAPAPADIATLAQLRALATRVEAAMDLPPDMRIMVHFRNDPNINAFATLGGQVVVFSGLLDVLDSEEAVAALLAHEFAHVRERHVIQSATSGLLLQIIWAMTLGDGVLGTAAGGIAGLPGLARTRAMEAEADAAALEASLALYGHAGGYFALFEALDSTMDRRREGLPAFLKSHPDPDARMAAARAALNGRPESGPATPWRAPEEDAGQESD